MRSKTHNKAATVFGRILLILAIGIVLLAQGVFAFHDHKGKLKERTDCAICLQFSSAGDMATGSQEPPPLPGSWTPSTPYRAPQKNVSLLAPSARDPPTGHA